MIKNVGKTDKIIRLIIGVILIVISFTSSMWFALLGVILIITAATGFCGIYKIFGINTCPHELTTPAPTEIKPVENQNDQNTLETKE